VKSVSYLVLDECLPPVIGGSLEFNGHLLSWRRHTLTLAISHHRSGANHRATKLTN